MAWAWPKNTRLDDRVLVRRVVQRLADLDVVQRRLRDVQDDERRLLDRESSAP